MQFRNPNNGYIETGGSGVSILWCLLFGPLYFAYRNVWSHAVISFFLAMFTGGLTWFLYPFFAPSIVNKSYRRRGWKEYRGVSMLPPPPPVRHLTTHTSKAVSVVLAVALFLLFNVSGADASNSSYCNSRCDITCYSYGQSSEICIDCNAKCDAVLRKFQHRQRQHKARAARRKLCNWCRDSGDIEHATECMQKCPSSYWVYPKLRGSIYPESYNGI